MAALLVNTLAAASAFEGTFDRPVLEDALSIGNSRIDSVHARFHQPYRITVGTAPVDYIDVVTPFRKVVLAAESRTRSGGRSFGLRDAQEFVGAADDLVVQVELTFHPLNTFIGVPDYKVVLAGAREVLPASIVRIPRSGPRVEGVPSTSPPTPGGVIMPKRSQPVTGGTLIAHFATSDLDPRGVYEAHVMDGAKVLGKARIDFAKLR